MEQIKSPMPPAGIFLARRCNALLTNLCESSEAVQAGTPMAVPGDIAFCMSLFGGVGQGSVPPYLLAANIPAGGLKSFLVRGCRGV